MNERQTRRQEGEEAASLKELHRGGGGAAAGGYQSPTAGDRDYGFGSHVEGREDSV